MVQQDHERRVRALRDTQDVDYRRARALEGHRAQVEQALLVLRSAIASAMPWPDIEKMVHNAKAHGDPVALLISKIDLG